MLLIAYLLLSICKPEMEFPKAKHHDRVIYPEFVVDDSKLAII